MKPVNEQVMVITGASSGIGLATALAAADEGALLVLIEPGSTNTPFPEHARNYMDREPALPEVRQSQTRRPPLNPNNCFCGSNASSSSKKRICVPSRLRSTWRIRRISAPARRRRLGPLTSEVHVV